MPTIFGILRLENSKSHTICRNHYSTFTNCSSNYQTLRSRIFCTSCYKISTSWHCMATRCQMRHEITVDSSFGVKRISSSKSKFATEAMTVSKFHTKPKWLFITVCGICAMPNIRTFHLFLFRCCCIASRCPWDRMYFGASFKRHFMITIGVSDFQPLNASPSSLASWTPHRFDPKLVYKLRWRRHFAT